MNNNKVKMSASNQLPSIDKIFKEDDDDFTPSVGSNLGAVFGTMIKLLETSLSVNFPLRHGSAKNYTSDQSQSQTSSVPKKEVILAKAVHAYKLQNGQYVSIGKVGIALAGSAVAKQYDIILYKGTQDYISTVAITLDFCYTVEANNYASYYDGNKNNWSILFDNRESSIQFATEICGSKYFTKKKKIEEMAKAAEKYELLRAEYKPRPDDGNGHGDYPDLPGIPAGSKDPYYPYDYPELLRNFKEYYSKALRKFYASTHEAHDIAKRVNII